MSGGYGDFANSMTQGMYSPAPKPIGLSGYNRQAYNLFGGPQMGGGNFPGYSHPTLNTSKFGYNIPPVYANPTQDPLYGTPLNKGYNPFQQGIL